jgi:hypothetical protein
MQLVSRGIGKASRWEAALRATSHMSQEPWPCNDEDPRLSSKGCTMSVGKTILCSHRSSSTMWNDHVAGLLHILLAEKRGEGLFQYSMSQTISIWENYLVVFVYLGISPYNLLWNLSFLEKQNCGTLNSMYIIVVLTFRAWHVELPRIVGGWIGR